MITHSLPHTHTHTHTHTPTHTHAHESTHTRPQPRDTTHRRYPLQSHVWPDGARWM